MKRCSGLVWCLIFAFTVGMSSTESSAQEKKKEIKPVIFAVLHDGKTIEPIAQIDGKKLVAPARGDDDSPKIKSFTDQYYKEKTDYRFIFGGKENGAVKVESFNPNSECSSNMASVRVSSKRVNLRGFVMGLSTDKTIPKPGSGVRRLPTRAERIEIEALVRAEFTRNKVDRAKVFDFKYHNLTALDLNNDGIAEQVGTFFVPTSSKERALLFFIAQKSKQSGKYYFAFSEFQNVKESEVMSEDITALDSGIYNELLLDAFDFDDDGVSEVFTLVQGFESNSFKVYTRKGAKWVRIFEGSNYHCAY